MPYTQPPSTGGSGGSASVDDIQGASALGKSLMKAQTKADAQTALGVPDASALGDRLKVAADSPMKPTDVWVCTTADVPATRVAGRLYLVFEAV